MEMETSTNNWNFFNNFRSLPNVLLVVRFGAGAKITIIKKMEIALI